MLKKVKAIVFSSIAFIAVIGLLSACKAEGERQAEVKGVSDHSESQVIRNQADAHDANCHLRFHEEK